MRYVIVILNRKDEWEVLTGSFATFEEAESHFARHLLGLFANKIIGIRKTGKNDRVEIIHTPRRKRK